MIIVQELGFGTPAGSSRLEDGGIYEFINQIPADDKEVYLLTLRLAKDGEKMRVYLYKGALPEGPKFFQAVKQNDRSVILRPFPQK